MYRQQFLSALLMAMCLLYVSKWSQAQHMSMPMHHHTEPGGRNVFLVMMDSMMVKMDGAPKGRSPGADFLKQMLPHHQGAIVMAQYELQHGKNFEMLQLAKSIIAEQQTEIQQMMLLLNTPGDTEMAGAVYRSAIDKTMDTMMEHLPAQESLTDVDHAFAAVMLPHHQAAVDMSRVVLRFSKDKLVLAFAGQLISDEQIEIEQMLSYLKSK